MNNLMNPQFLQLAKDIAKENNKTIKQLFKNKINGSFLIKIKNEVIAELGAEFPQIFPPRFDNAQVVIGDNQTPEYDICRIISGVHRHHSIFLTKEEIKRNQNSIEYQKMLISEVVEKVRLNHLSNMFFRKKQLLSGDEFLYFPVPYQLFALCIRFHYLLQEYKPPILVYYVDIINNALSALTLMENNLLSNAYSPCRSMIEQYLKMLILQKHPDCIESYSKFCEFEVIHSFCRQKYPDEFIYLYNNCILPTAKRIEYLHYGWLDSISTYETKTNRYSLYGILEYIQKDADIELRKALNELMQLYKTCHGYTHGSSMNVKYPLVQYFELSTMLYYVVKNIFLYLHDEFEIEMNDKEIELIKNLDRDFETLYRQSCMRSTENFELYYNN